MTLPGHEGLSIRCPRDSIPPVIRVGLLPIDLHRDRRLSGVRPSRISMEPRNRLLAAPSHEHDRLAGQWAAARAHEADDFVDAAEGSDRALDPAELAVAERV